MGSIDREQLSRFIEQSIDHQDNPESFRYQMESQIGKFLKAHEHHLKVAQTKQRVQRIMEADLLKRKALEAALNEKMSKSKERKDKKLEVYTQALSDLRKRKEATLREKIKMQRKEQLKQSLQKISQIEEKHNKVMQSRINRSSSDNTLRSSSRYQMRIEAEDLERASLLQKLDRKGTFRMPTRIMSELYFQKAQHILKKNEEQEAHKVQRLAQSLSKVDKARQKKQKVLAERSQKIGTSQRYKFEVNRHRYNEVQTNRIIKIKELMLEQGLKMKKGESRLSDLRQGERNNQSSRLSVTQNIEGTLGNNLKQGSYRENIRKCIDNFLKGKK